MNASVNPGRGSRRHNHLRFGVDVDDEMVGKLRCIAADHGCSLAEAIRTVLTWGLEGADQSATRDP